MVAAAMGGLLTLPSLAIGEPPRAGVCGNQSWIDCMGSNTGDYCYTAEGRLGVCRYDKISFTPPDACECYTGRRRPRR